jgi:chemotaxis receptor (MCP) glutamine deamidase CheD
MRLQAVGAKQEDLEAKMVGAANMLRTFDSGAGAAILESARTTLAKRRIPLVGESVGGSVGRSVEFSIASWIVTVKSKF